MSILSIFRHLFISQFIVHISISICLKEFMVQLQTFTSSDYLSKEKIRTNYFVFFNQQKYNFKILRMCSDLSEWFLRRPHIGRIFLVIYNWLKWLDPYFWVLIWLMDINFNALSKLLADCNLSLPTLGVESLKQCCCCSMKSYIVTHPIYLSIEFNKLSIYLLYLGSIFLLIC